MLVVAKYYSRIRSDRLAQLLDLSPASAEEALSAMVVSHAVSAKIDRPAGKSLSFPSPPNPPPNIHTPTHPPGPSSPSCSPPIVHVSETLHLSPKLAMAPMANIVRTSNVDHAGRYERVTNTAVQLEVVLKEALNMLLWPLT